MGTSKQKQVEVDVDNMVCNKCMYYVKDGELEPFCCYFNQHIDMVVMLDLCKWVSYERNKS